MKIITRSTKEFKYDTFRLVDVNDKTLAYYILRYVPNVDYEKLDQSSLLKSRKYKTWFKKFMKSPDEHMTDVKIYR